AQPGEQVEIGGFELFGRESEPAAANIVADREAIQDERQFKSAGEQGFDVFQDFVGEPFRFESGGVDMRTTHQRAGATARARDLLDLSRCVTKAGQGGWNGSVDDLEIAAAG